MCLTLYQRHHSGPVAPVKGAADGFLARSILGK
jgi:hypothetical protein